MSGWRISRGWALLRPPYRSAVGLEAALDELSRCAGTQFDPAVVTAVAAVLTAIPATTGA